MKIHTTNYKNTFIEVAEDCPVTKGEIPSLKNGKETVASLQFKLLKDSPYIYTSDEVLFKVHTLRNELTEAEFTKAHREFFSKGQPCMRASPLTKRYGWGIHSDNEGKMALVNRDSEKYEKLLKEEGLAKVKAMRSKRK